MAGTQQAISYVVQHCEKSFCNKCSSKLSLLCPKEVNAYSNWPSRINLDWSMFYICFNCRTVYQVGIGKVEREKADER